MQENHGRKYFLTLLQNAPHPLVFPLTDDYLCLDSLLKVYPPFVGTAACLRFLLPSVSLKTFQHIMHGVR